MRVEKSVRRKVFSMCVFFVITVLNVLSTQNEFARLVHMYQRTGGEPISQLSTKKELEMKPATTDQFLSRRLSARSWKQSLKRN